MASHKKIHVINVYNCRKISIPPTFTTTPFILTETYQDVITAASRRADKRISHITVPVTANGIRMVSVTKPPALTSNETTETPHNSLNNTLLPISKNITTQMVPNSMFLSSSTVMKPTTTKTKLGVSAVLYSRSTFDTSKMVYFTTVSNIESARGTGHVNGFHYIILIAIVGTLVFVLVVVTFLSPCVCRNKCNGK